MTNRSNHIPRFTSILMMNMAQGVSRHQRNQRNCGAMTLPTIMIQNVHQ